jgi:hypothetical protein
MRLGAEGHIHSGRTCAASHLSKSISMAASNGRPGAQLFRRQYWYFGSTKVQFLTPEDRCALLWSKASLFFFVPGNPSMPAVSQAAAVFLSASRALSHWGGLHFCVSTSPFVQVKRVNSVPRRQQQHPQRPYRLGPRFPGTTRTRLLLPR